MFQLRILTLNAANIRMIGIAGLVWLDLSQLSGDSNDLIKFKGKWLLGIKYAILLYISEVLRDIFIPCEAIFDSTAFILCCTS